MIKTLLFGAGQGALQFISNTIDTRLIIGFIDNDTKKHGQIFAGHKVYSPDQLDCVEYDEIVITTQWALEVQQQLLNDGSISNHKIVLPEKKMLKKSLPFEDLETRNLAENIITTLCGLAITQATMLCVDFGTLLGILRDSEIISWDDDVDFAAPLQESDKVEKILTDFVNQQPTTLKWHVEKLQNKSRDVIGFLLKFEDPNQRLIEFTTSISLRAIEKGMSKHLPSLGMWAAPSRHFEKLVVKEWKNQSILIPSHPEEYLTFQYGDWKKPKKNMQLSDYHNLNEVAFDDIKDASISLKLLKT